MKDYSTPILELHGWKRTLRFILLAAVAVLFLAPALWMISSSLKPDYEIFATPPTLWPTNPRWENYTEALTSLPFGRFAVNTMIIAIGSIIGHLLSCSIVAYGFARLNAPGKGFFFVLMLSTLMLPYPVTMVPLFIIFAKLRFNQQLCTVDPADILRQCFLYLLAAPGFQTNPAGPGRGGEDRWSDHTPGAAERDLAAVAPRPGNGGNFHFPGGVE